MRTPILATTRPIDREFQTTYKGCTVAYDLWLDEDGSGREVCEDLTVVEFDASAADALETIDGIVALYEAGVGAPRDAARELLQNLAWRAVLAVESEYAAHGEFDVCGSWRPEGLSESEWLDLISYVLDSDAVELQIYEEV